MARHPVGWAMVNAGFVSVLTLLALFTFDRSFADRTYLVVGAVGMAVPLVLAVLLHLSGMLVGRFTLFVYAIFLPLAALTVFARPTPWAVGQVARATVEAPQILLTTIPPVNAEGVVLVLPFTLGYLAGAAGTWLALRSHRAVVPVLPLLLVLVLCVLFGTEDTAAVLVKSSIFVAVALWWIAIRAGSDPAVAHAHRGGLARATVAGTVVAAVAVGATVTIGDISDRLVLRGMLGTGYDVGRLDNPLADFDQFRDEAADRELALKPLLTVRGLPRRVPVRFLVLDSYDGVEWSPGNDTVLGTREDRFQQLGEEVGTTAEGRVVRVRIDLRRLWNSDWLPLAGYLTSLDFDGPDVRSPLAEVRYNPATGSAGVTGELKPEDDYRFTAVVPPTRLPRDAEPFPHAGELQPEGDFLDDYLAPWRREPVDPIEQVLLLAEYLKVTGYYSDGAAIGDSEVPRGHSKEALAAFAFAPVGNDEQYAAFLALAANRLGVPARVVVGAHQGEKRRGTPGIVRAADVEAWVEVQISDGTWRMLPTDSFLGTQDPALAKQTPEEFLDRKKGERQGARPEEPRSEEAEQSTDDSGVGLAWLPGVAVIGLILVVALVPLVKLVRRRRRRSRRGSAAVVAGWRDLVDTARDLGYDVPVRATRPDQARTLATADPAGGSVALAERADALTFAPLDPGDAVTDEYWEAVRRERRLLASRRSPLRRLRARWSLASLRARRR